MTYVSNLNQPTGCKGHLLPMAIMSFMLLLVTVDVPRWWNLGVLGNVEINKKNKAVKAGTLVMMISGSPGYPADFQWQLIPKCQLQGIKLNYCMFPLLEDGDIRYIYIYISERFIPTIIAPTQFCQTSVSKREVFVSFWKWSWLHVYGSREAIAIVVPPSLSFLAVKDHPRNFDQWFSFE